MKKHHLIVALSLSAAGCAGVIEQPSPYDPIVEAQALCSRIYDEAMTSNGEAWLATGREKFPDFDAVVLNRQLSITETMRDLIVLSELGHDIAYYLGHHPAEARTIALRSPVAQAHAFGRIEAKIAADLGHVISVTPGLTASEAILKCIERVAPQKIHVQ